MVSTFSIGSYLAQDNGPCAMLLDTKYDFDESTHQFFPVRFHQRRGEWLAAAATNSEVRKKVRCAQLSHTFNVSDAFLPRTGRVRSCNLLDQMLDLT